MTNPPSLLIPHLTWTSGNLLIVNPLPKMEAYLHYRHRSLEYVWEERRRRSVEEKVQLFTVIKEQGPRIIQTFQGFLDALVEISRKAGVEPVFTDRRTWFPEPKMELVHGFRCNQAQLFEQFIRPQRSGLLQAVTRYGKSTMIANTMRAFPGIKTVLAAPGIDLLGQLQKDLQAKLPGREVLGIFTGSKGKKQSDDITVTSLDSLHHIDHEGTKLLLIDEPHAAVSESRAPVLAKFCNARIYGFGATLSGRYDGADKLITGLIGPVLARRTYQEAVAEKAICPIKVWMLKMKFPRFEEFNRDRAYRRLVFLNQDFNAIVKQIVDQQIPRDFQTIIFADEVEQIELFNTFVTEGVPAVAGKMKKTERNDLFGKMVRNEIKRCIATDIFSTGVTFPELRAIVNSASGGSGITATQKPGRLAEVRPNKTFGHVVDFLWECNEFPEDLQGVDNRREAWKAVVQDSRSRLEVYRNNGYDVEIVGEIADIKIT